MKVILLRDVAKIGRRFEIKEVPDGYALNKLIPKKDAEPATPINVKRIMARTKSVAATKEGELAEAKAVSAACALEPLQIAMEANEQGHLFQAIHTKEVVRTAAARGLRLDEATLSIPTPIKVVGTHHVVLTVAHTIFDLAIEVVAKKK
jgi:large subunit ribosomal protein L9